jgi:hypothetical protein
MTKLYLDIDGVLLTKRLTEPAEHVAQFIEYLTENFECFWLTTHCKGNERTALGYLKQFLDQHVIEQLERVKPTMWTTMKTEALDLTCDFYWLDDNPFQMEIEFLRSHDKLDRLILVDLNNKDELLKIKKRLPPTRTKPNA